MKEISHREFSSEKPQPEIFDFETYQIGAARTATYPDAGTEDQFAKTYVILGLAGEVGELANAWKKVLRGDYAGGMTLEAREKLLGEVGDCLWYLSRICSEFGVTLNYVARSNLEKLASRQERNQIKGSGDNR
ncbi:MAG: nucleoside triphosphate pyrophosphohydrolase family protein [Bacteroidota bacterium]|jgi:NTP pyrophosphatase (non-canonical NTP hydrolase)